MKIFSGSSNKPLAKKIAKLLKIGLSPLDIHIFPDQEKRVRVVDKVVGEDCVVVQSTSPNADKNYMELFFIIDALKRSGAKSVTAVIPYVGYERQDHVFRDGEAVSLEVIIKILESLGVGKVIAIDLHSVKIPELFNVPVVHLSMLPIFARTIKEKGWDDNNTVLVSPDMGGIRRIKMLSEMLGDLHYLTIEKDRDLRTGEISMEKMRGEVKKRAIIVDDMISTGGTIIGAASLLCKKGAREVFVFATHPVFSGEASKVLEDSVAKKIFVTDTIDIPAAKKFPKLEVLSAAGIIAKNLKSQISNRKTTTQI